jgi:hypothetical protein
MKMFSATAVTHTLRGLHVMRRANIGETNRSTILATDYTRENRQSCKHNCEHGWLRDGHDSDSIAAQYDVVYQRPLVGRIYNERKTNFNIGAITGH